MSSRLLFSSPSRVGVQCGRPIVFSQHLGLMCDPTLSLSMAWVFLGSNWIHCWRNYCPYYGRRWELKSSRSRASFEIWLIFFFTKSDRLRFRIPFENPDSRNLRDVRILTLEIYFCSGWTQGCLQQSNILIVLDGLLTPNQGSSLTLSIIIGSFCLQFPEILLMGSFSPWILN